MSTSNLFLYWGMNIPYLIRLGKDRTVSTASKLAIFVIVLGSNLGSLIFKV